MKRNPKDPKDQKSAKETAKAYIAQLEGIADYIEDPNIRDTLIACAKTMIMTVAIDDPEKLPALFKHLKWGFEVAGRDNNPENAESLSEELRRRLLSVKPKCYTDDQLRSERDIIARVPTEADYKHCPMYYIMGNLRTSPHIQGEPNEITTVAVRMRDFRDSEYPVGGVFWDLDVMLRLWAQISEENRITVSKKPISEWTREEVSSACEDILRSRRAYIYADFDRAKEFCPKCEKHLAMDCHCTEYIPDQIVEQWNTTVKKVMTDAYNLHTDTGCDSDDVLELQSLVKRVVAINTNIYNQSRILMPNETREERDKRMVKQHVPRLYKECALAVKLMNDIRRDELNSRD